MGPLSKEEFQDQIIANRVAHGVRGTPYIHSEFHTHAFPLKIESIACINGNGADECQCASNVTGYCRPLLPVCRISLGCIVMLCTAASGSVTDIPDNNTSHITEECRTASLGARQQPAGEGGCHCYRLIDHNVSD